ncbi:MAG TPA: FAD/NAD(P)-binding protein [Polyangiaceae bacterium]|jgi:uncharacterized NAD(P)/FAD-binding protein YdhS|nr:FAD/NAD(P)-binding protein [Polyangiaceae bacterium]
MDTDAYDLVVIGGGLSGGQLIVSLLDLVLAGGGARRLRIALVDRIGDFGAGIPYGEQTTQPGFLLIETVEESTPSGFVEWLRLNTARLLESSDGASLGWLSENRQRLEAGNYSELFVPRRLFGWFAGEQLEERIRRASAKGLASVTTIKAEAHDVVVEDQFRVDLDGAPSCRARVVTLAIGCIPPAQRYAVGVVEGFVHQPHGDAFASLAKVIAQKARDSRRIDVAILGSGASASEVIYFLAHSPELIAAIRTIRVVSSSGRLSGDTLGAPRAAGADANPARNRPSSREYVAAACGLVACGKLTIQQGKVLNVSAQDGKLAVTMESNDEPRFGADVVVGCTGAGDVERNSSTLLKNLLSPGRPFRANHRRKGFVMQPDSFEVEGVQGCFVIGPLLNRSSPNIIVESIPEVYRVAPVLAAAIHRRLQGQDDRR